MNAGAAGGAGAGAEAVTGAGPQTRHGSVTLVGAGPGPSDLLTVRAWRVLHEADVVVVDRLVSPEVLELLAPGVEVLDVGKSPGGRAARQEDINALLVERAARGLRVVRLKGGDPFVFGRGGEELLACAEAGIATQVVPGLTSAVAVPTLAGVPVTHRGVSQSFTVVSGHLPPGHPESTVDWPALGAGSDTIVLLMGVATLSAIAAALVAGGREPGTPAVAIENGGLPGQRVLRATLAGIGAEAAAADLTNPAVTVIGPVASALGASTATTGPV